MKISYCINNYISAYCGQSSKETHVPSKSCPNCCCAQCLNIAVRIGIVICATNSSVGQLFMLAPLKFHVYSVCVVWVYG